MGELQLAEAVRGEARAIHRAEALEARGTSVLIRDPDGRLFTLGQFLARPPEPTGLTPEDILRAARDGRLNPPAVAIQPSALPKKAARKAG